MACSNPPSLFLSATEFASAFVAPLHQSFILGLDQLKPDSFEYCATEHLKMSAVYWCCMSMDLMGELHRIDREEVIRWVLECQHSNGGFGGNKGHDPHLLYTTSAVQILILLEDTQHIQTHKDNITQYVCSLQQPDGSFCGDCWGEVDTRFTYCALNCLSLLQTLDRIDIQKAVQFGPHTQRQAGWVDGCHTTSVPVSDWYLVAVTLMVASVQFQEQNHMQDKVRISPLSIHTADRSNNNNNKADLMYMYEYIGVLGWWLSERQLSVGGLNGRPEKKPDVCYSWWVLSVLSMIGHLDWIDGKALIQYILSCQDKTDGGGIADRPGNIADPFHTFFGIAGLSLLGCPTLKQIDPVYAMPTRCIDKLGIRKPYQSAMPNPEEQLRQ